ncbi:MAG: aquaporin [Deltaproteobacteria bacterium]|nr:aquaporin [Deltaproteobacteria bacterium]
MKYARDFAGEFIGTFILVFFGCGSVVVTVLFSALIGLFQVAIIWGIGVALAIYATRHLSCAHLNPAVSVAMVVGKRMSPSKLPVYLVAQLAGAFFAAAILYVLFSSSITQYESIHAIVRGTPESVKTAMMFGEFYPNPGAGNTAMVSTWTAILAEGFGTFGLVFMIFALTEGCNLGRPDDSLAPLFIGLTVTAIISILAPLTQAGLNPARDLAPRLFSYLVGWGDAAFPDNHYGFLTVYVLGPIAGGIIAALVFTKIIEPLFKNKANDDCLCR